MKNIHKPKGVYEKYVKRLLDIVCALLAIIVFWWLYAIVAILVKVNLGSPVLYRQKRPGKNEIIFELYKFRTMTDERDEKGELLPDDTRLTKFGKFLRSTSLDELPEVINILKGNMSVVGPRPLLVEYLPYYSEEEKHRHDVRPGLSGWAQINGRNYLSWEDKFKLDLFYVDQISFKLDLYIIFKTLYKAIKRSDIEEADSVYVDEEGKKWSRAGGTVYKIYDPLHIERKERMREKSEKSEKNNDFGWR